MTLHDLTLPEGGWWACRFPERPYDGFTWWDERCRNCVIAMGAAARMLPSEPVFDDETLHQGNIVDVYNWLAPGHGLPALS